MSEREEKNLEPLPTVEFLRAFQERERIGILSAQ